MKMKSVVLAAATAVASSAFAQIFTNGDVYAEWFTTNSVQTDAIMPDGKFDTPLGEPVVITNAANQANGYAVTAQVSIVVHAELPAVPSPFDNLSPKGAICAAVTNSPSISTNWYGLADGVWVALTGVDTPTETGHILVMEFKDKDCHQVRYSIDGHYCTYNGDDWLVSRSEVAPSRVAFAGMGSYTSLTGILVNEKVAPSVSAVSWTEGYDFTNGTVSVSLGSYYSSTMGDVSLVVKDSAGNQVGGAVSLNDTNPHSANLTLTPGGTYTYSIVQDAGGVVTTKDVGTFVAAAPGAGFSASAEGGSSVVTNGAWETAAPAVDNAKYTISGSEVFNIGNGVLEANKLVIVDNKVTFTTWGDANDLQDFDDGTFAAITAVTNDSGAVVWKAYKGPENGWLDLVGGVTSAALDAPYDIRATFDFSGANPKMAFSMKASGDSAFIPFTCNNNAWITSTVATNVLSEVGYSGIGKLTSVVGGNSDTNIAAVGATSYATLADAIAAATNGSNTVTLRTNTQWPSTTPVGVYTVLTNGFSLVGLPSGDGITITPSGVGFNIVVAGGSSHISGAGNININKDDMAALDINGKSPAEIAAELTKTQSNGIEKWANYVLGIDGNASTNKPFAAPVQNSSSDKLTFSLGGVNVKEGTGATVSYSVEELASPDAAPGSGKTQTTNESSTVEFDVPNGVKYYRVKVTITLPE